MPIPIPQQQLQKLLSDSWKEERERYWKEERERYWKEIDEEEKKKVRSRFELIDWS